MQKATTLPVAPRERLLVSIREFVQFRYCAVLTVLATYGLIVLGGTVRATDSGTACPDWPLCHGRVVPQFETHVMIEYSHRLVASIVGFMILVVAVWVWRRYRGDKLMTRAAGAAVVLLVVQVLVGAATVDTETDGSVVALHLSVALTLLATLIVIAVAAFGDGRAPLVPSIPQDEREGRGDERGKASFGISKLAIATLVAVFALVISGAYVSQEGAGLAYPDWPLFDGKLTSSGGKLADLHYLHRMLAAFVGVLMLALVVRTLRTERRGLARVIVTFAFAVYVAQVLFGASNIWFELATSVRIIHLALASGLWGVLVFGVAWPFPFGSAQGRLRLRTSGVEAAAEENS